MTEIRTCPAVAGPIKYSPSMFRAMCPVLEWEKQHVRRVWLFGSILSASSFHLSIQSGTKTYSRPAARFASDTMKFCDIHRYRVGSRKRVC
jgi:hypothetical protein